MHSLRFICSSVLVSTMVATAPAQAASWSAVDIGSVGGATYAEGVNDLGQVVGYSYFQAPSYPGQDPLYHAFMTGAAGAGIRDLGVSNGYSSRAYAINASGQVAGETYHFDDIGGPVFPAFVTGPNGSGVTYIDGTVASNGTAFGINDKGQVAGRIVSRGAPHAYSYGYLTGPNGEGMTRLTLGSGNLVYALGVNESGQVTGWGNVTQNPNDPNYGAYLGFITGANGVGVTMLGTLGGRYSKGTAINDLGQVVGESLLATFDLHAFITGANGVGMTDIGTLGTGSSALGVNNLGQVVGSSYLSGGSYLAGSIRHAFVTGANGVGMTDLNSLVLLDNGDYLTEATGISDTGWLIANSFKGHAYLINSAVPEPETYALLLVGLGVVGAAARRRQAA